MRATIDFRYIRGDLPGGQRAAFEELVCQLAYREQHVPNSHRRIEGSGGDGGVECIQANFNGGFTGYQAKYHTAPTEIDWTKINKSVQTALTLHPRLSTYVIAVACDFTGRRRHKADSVIEGSWGAWETHTEQWRSAASATGRDVEFIVWTASDLKDRLLRPSADGLRAYWFGGLEFSPKWFADKLQATVRALGERYHPEDHVEVEAEISFDYLVRHPRTRKRLNEQFTVLREHRIQFHRQLDHSTILPSGLLGAVNEAIEQVLTCETETADAPSVPWNVDKWQEQVKECIHSINLLLDWIRSERTKDGGEGASRAKSGDELDYLLYSLTSVQSVLHQLQSLLQSRYFVAERLRVMLVYGRAGTGKSHLLARAAESAAAESRPVILLLGQQFQLGAVWPQVLQRLGVPHLSVDEFLAALDAAAEIAGARGVIVVDAINEGPGASLWRNEIAVFLEHLRPYKNLACVVSCRTEYLQYAVPERELSTLPRTEVLGFRTADEQAKAARVYLDKRGIARPATPWLAPEFINPLFLRSCCSALQRDGKSEFPRGLSGAKQIFAFYIESVARSLGVGRDGSSDLVAPTVQTLLGIAKEMAVKRQDYVDRCTAHAIAARQFEGFPPPSDQTWLDILQRNGLLRADPDPQKDWGDPLQLPLEVVRFSFQRFQDHLIAEALLNDIVDIRGALASGGELSFVHDGVMLRWGWQGLLEALSVQIPERYHMELIDALPGHSDVWWEQYHAQDAFRESVRWRSSNAFSARTSELFSRLERVWGVLIEIAAVTEHPWNADHLHRKLVGLTMPERDAEWSLTLSDLTDETAYSIDNLIDWSLHVQDKASSETLRLCSLALTWCFTATHRPIRDRATKALTSILLARPKLFPALVSAFNQVDDLYVLERLYAAAFGACCLDLSVTRLALYAEAAYRNIFADRTPPKNLLLRDYARGIVELAVHNGLQLSELELAECRPPYDSPLPDLNIPDDELEEEIGRAGDDTIADSCYGPFSDFGHYEVEWAIQEFAKTALTENPRRSSRRDNGSLDVEAAKRWIAKRAYSYGWTKNRFPYDSHLHREDSRGRPRVERIGKKYQWLALSELLCQLADNYWLDDVHGSTIKKYDTPVDIGSFRDIDPTVLPEMSITEVGHAGKVWMLGPEIVVTDIEEDRLAEWPFLADPGSNLAGLIERTDPEGRTWLVLYDHRIARLQHDHRTSVSRSLRQEEFRLLYCIVTDDMGLRNLRNRLMAERQIDVGDWQPQHLINDPYLFEAPWRATWPQQKWDAQLQWKYANTSLAFPICEYQWEPHLDASLPDGIRAFVLSPWLALQLDLAPERSNSAICRDQFSGCQFAGAILEPEGSSALVDAKVFHTYLDNNDLRCLWLFVAERNAWSRRDPDIRAKRRSEGLVWFEGGATKTVTWRRDQPA